MEAAANSDLSSCVSEVSSDTTGVGVVPKLAAASVQGRTSGPTRRSTKGGWTEQEDDMLSKAVKVFNGKNWKKIAECFPGRSDVQCLHRWQKVLNPDLVKGPWTKEEDDLIIELVKKYGSKKWSVIAQSLPGRIGKQCRERWHNHLNPEIKKHAWTREEELILIRAHRMYGNKWAELAKFLPGRADNSIKNHWNCSVKKKLDSYLASEFTEDPVCINANDYNHNYSEGSMNRNGAKCDPETVCFFVQEDSDSDVDTSLGVSLLGASKGRQRNLNLHSESGQRRQHQKEFDCGSPVAGGLSSESTNTHGHGDLSNISSRPSAGLSLSLSISSDPVTSKGIVESPKRPRRYESLCTEKKTRLESSPFSCSTPPSHVRTICSSCSPEAILRSAAKKFKKTPSIFRKRTRETCEKKCNGNECTSEVRSEGCCEHVVVGGLDDPTTAHVLNVKWLSLSCPDVWSKSVEKRLEYAFDLEWDNAKSQGSAPADSSGVMSDGNLMQLGFGICYNPVI